MIAQGAALAIGRRRVFEVAVGAAIAGGALLVAARPARAQSTSDIDALNFLLNISYLQAQFFSYVATGAGLTPLIGTGTAGAVTPGRAVALDVGVKSIVAEMANDSRNIATPMRTIIGALAVGQPALDITGGTAGPFAQVMQQAGVVAAGATFDPYASEENFLYCAFYLNDLAVSAYLGMVPSLSNRVVVQLVGGMVATQSHHAATIRSLLYQRGATTARIRTNADRISAFRASLGGATASEQGVSASQRTYAAAGGPVTVAVSNVIPADATGTMVSRSSGQALRLLYLNAGAASQGGFFPAGVNGTIVSSTVA